ncbi:MAG: DUF6463 family protein [Oscillatoriaceae cyanobacterium Prado104]|jgi:hypothetical protein|nr:DUF6463 family protein [Oscillatoriaceae cyanobacterium Prado104]
MKKINGLALIAIGLLHSAIALGIPGAMGFSGIWQEIIDLGAIDAAKPNELRIWGYYWLLMPGFLLILFGFLCHWIENQLNLPLPAFVGWGLLIFSCFGILLDIDTGFWLVLLVAVNAIVTSRQAKVEGLYDGSKEA